MARFGKPNCGSLTDSFILPVLTVIQSEGLLRKARSEESEGAGALIEVHRTADPSPHRTSRPSLWMTVRRRATPLRFE